MVSARLNMMKRLFSISSGTPAGAQIYVCLNSGGFEDSTTGYDLSPLPPSRFACYGGQAGAMRKERPTKKGKEPFILTSLQTLHD